MTLDQLKYFLAAAQHEHITRAAQASHISSSVVSSAVKSLEDELEVKLFEHIGRRVALTDRGRQLRLEAERILSDLSSLPLKLRDVTPELKGHYRIAASHFLSARILAPSISAVQAKHPLLTFDISATSTPLLFSDVLSGRLEAALCFLPVKHPDIEEKVLYEGDHEIVVRSGHPLTKKKSIDLAKDLSHYPAAYHKVSSAHDVSTYASVMRKYGVNNNPVSTYDNADIGHQLVANSDARTIVPDIAVRFLKKEFGVLRKPRDWRLPLRISFIRRKQLTANPALTELALELASSLRGR